MRGHTCTLEPSSRARSRAFAAALLLLSVVALAQVIGTAAVSKPKPSSSSSPAAAAASASNAARRSSNSTFGARSKPGDSKPGASRPKSAPTSSSSISGGISSLPSSTAAPGRLCSDAVFRIGSQLVRSFSDLSRLFAHYTPLPKLGSRHIVAVDVLVQRPCGAFTHNSTFYLRVGVRDAKIFKQVFQAQVLRGCRTVFKSGPSPRRILDLGARTGMSTAYLATHFPEAQVIATEPSLMEFSLLRLNTAKFSNVRAEYGAVWDSLTTLKLSRGLDSSRHPSASASVHGSQLWKRFVIDVVEVATGGRLGDVVPSITVPDLLQRHGWADVDLLNADLDGAEKAVLGDAAARTWLQRVRCISLRLAPDLLPSAVAKLLGPEYARAGRVLDQFLWCRTNSSKTGVGGKV